MEKERKKLTVLLVIPFLLFWHWFEPAAKTNDEGIKAFQEQKYAEALKQFLTAKGLKPEMPQLKNNTAAALYQMKKYNEALEEFSSINPEKADIPTSDFYYNLGNSYFRLNQFEKALENYKKSLKINAGDINTKKNFELTQKKIEEEKKKEDQNKNKNKDQDKKDQKEKQPEPQQQEQKADKKHQDMMRYLDQNEKKQMEKQKRAVGITKKEKDW